MPPHRGTNPSEVPTVLAGEVDGRSNVSPPEEGSAGLVLSSSPPTQVKLERWRVPDHPLVAGSETITYL